MSDRRSRPLTSSPSCGGSGVADVDDSGLARALYSTDASLYRVVPAGRRAAAQRRGGARDRRGLPRHRHPADVARRRHVDRRQRGRHRRRLDFTRHLNRVHDIDVEARTARVDPGAVHAVLQRAAHAAGPAVRPRPVDPHPLHGRRHDRQQRLRLAGARLRPHGRQRRRARRRDDGGRAADARPPARRTSSPTLDACATSSPATWRRSAPSSAGSAARSRATASSTCCPSAASTSRRSWPAPRARWPR